MADKYAAWNLIFYIAVTVYVAGERNGNQNRLNLSLIELELLKEMEISVSSSSNFSLVIGGIVFIIWANAEPQPWAQSTFEKATKDESDGSIGRSESFAY